MPLTKVSQRFCNILVHTRLQCEYHLTETVQAMCDGKSTKIPKRDFIFARVKTGQVGT